MKSKPLVRYSTTKIMGTTLRYKQTLLITMRGPLARIFIEAHIRNEELIWSYDLRNRKVEIFRSELLDSVPEVKPNNRNERVDQKY